jgi:hypothetical protein
MAKNSQMDGADPKPLPLVTFVFLDQWGWATDSAGKITSIHPVAAGY